MTINLKLQSLEFPIVPDFIGKNHILRQLTKQLPLIKATLEDDLVSLVSEGLSENLDHKGKKARVNYMFRLNMAESVLAVAKSETPSSGESSSIESSEAIMDPDKMQKVVEITRNIVPVLEDFTASVLKDMRHEYKHDSRNKP